MREAFLLNLRQITFAAILVAFGASAHAAVPRNLEYFETQDQNYQSVDLAWFSELQKTYRSQHNYTASDFIPTNMENTTSQGKVMARIVNQSMQTFLKSDSVKNSSLAGVANNLNQEVKTVVQTSDNGTKHEFSFLLKGGNAQAAIRYKGLVSGEVAYSPEGHTTSIEINRDITKTTKLVYNSISNSDDSRNTLSVRWNW